MIKLASITPCAEKTVKEVNIYSDSGNIDIGNIGGTDDGVL